MNKEKITNKIFVFGNSDLNMDSLPLRILEKLREKFPEIIFEVKDPNEEWATPSSVEDGRPNQTESGFRDVLTIIDTVIGIKEVTVFDDLEFFSKVPHVGMHDFDALTNLRYLQKLGKIKKIKIIGIPPEISEENAFSGVSGILEKEKAVL